MEVEPHLARSPQILLLAPPGHGDDPYPGAFRPFPQLHGHFVAVHGRHAQVQEDDLGPERLGQIQGGRAVVGNPHFLAKDQVQQPPQAIGRSDIVIDDQDAATRDNLGYIRPGRLLRVECGGSAPREHAGNRTTNSLPIP